MNEPQAKKMEKNRLSFSRFFRRLQGSPGFLDYISDRIRFSKLISIDGSLLARRSLLTQGENKTVKGSKKFKLHC